MKRFAPATERNREPIREVLARELPAAGTVLELACGSGEHSIYMAAAFPHLTWQPTDVDPEAVASSAAWRTEAALPNLREPLPLDVCEDHWPVSEAAAITCINMVHIAPWSATLGMFRGAARLLGPGALLYLYGPYRFGGAFTAPSNEAFDQSLRSRDPAWGIRDVTELQAAASEFALRGVISMPANNHSLVFRRL
jgi:SAM-dependent methyltransferase